MEDSLTEGEKFKAKRLGGKKKNHQNYDRTAVRKEDRELQSSRNEVAKEGTVDRCNEESVGVIS